MGNCLLLHFCRVPYIVLESFDVCFVPEHLSVMEKWRLYVMPEVKTSLLTDSPRTCIQSTESFPGHVTSANTTLVG